ncbi:hypothetical protein HMPREF0454_01579 [Hafnia alvei ATCC 51873]|uniref:Uncharacterized protein n=1 Tax=Hafnia alvei ATCC 51873 TaxID=1002364 RepID=G9Y4R5_HAFAL|nr:hypothetical protein HMPREF0454_01579 [Hafnia alvei ATCC 51873]
MTQILLSRYSCCHRQPEVWFLIDIVLAQVRTVSSALLTNLLVQ